MIRSKQDKWLERAAYVILSLVIVIMLFPFLLLFMSSITEESSLLINGYSILPKKLSLSAYAYIWQSRDTIFHAYAVTILITFIGTFVNVMITAMVAYPLSLEKLPGKKILSFLLLFTMLFHGGLVPTYMVYTTVLEIKNTYLALLIPNLMFSAMNAILVRTYLRSNIPSELYEAARIDGAGELKIFLGIVLPLGKSILVTIGIFSGLTYWYDWMNGLYYITDSDKYSIQQLLNVMIKNMQYLSQYGSSVSFGAVPTVSLRMAIAFVAMLPILILYPFLQRYFEEGITLGAVKG